MNIELSRNLTGRSGCGEPNVIRFTIFPEKNGIIAMNKISKRAKSAPFTYSFRQRICDSPIKQDAITVTFFSELPSGSIRIKYLIRFHFKRCPPPKKNGSTGKLIS